MHVDYFVNTSTHTHMHMMSLQTHTLGRQPQSVCKRVGPVDRSGPVMFYMFHEQHVRNMGPTSRSPFFLKEFPFQSVRRWERARHDFS